MTATLRTCPPGLVMSVCGHPAVLGPSVSRRNRSGEQTDHRRAAASPDWHTVAMVGQSDWCAVVPLSPAAQAKTRLAPLGELRAALASALAADVVTALSGARSIARVLVVGDGSVLLPEDPAHTLVDSGTADLNGSIATAESHARRAGFERIVVVMADLPCIRPDDVDELLARARSVPRGFVRDHRGTGTTVLTTTGPGLIPRFGRSSAAEHRADGAIEFEVAVRLRFDVDDPEDVTLAMAFGLGPATAAALQVQAASGK